MIMVVWLTCNTETHVRALEKATLLPLGCTIGVTMKTYISPSHYSMPLSTSYSEERRPESVRARERLCQVAGSGGEGVEGWGVEPGTSPLLKEELQRRMEQE